MRRYRAFLQESEEEMSESLNDGEIDYLRIESLSSFMSRILMKKMKILLY